MMVSFLGLRMLTRFPKGALLSQSGWGTLSIQYRLDIMRKSWGEARRTGQEVQWPPFLMLGVNSMLLSEEVAKRSQGTTGLSSVKLVPTWTLNQNGTLAHAGHRGRHGRGGPPGGGGGGRPVQDRVEEADMWVLKRMFPPSEGGIAGGLRAIVDVSSGSVAERLCMCAPADMLPAKQRWTVFSCLLCPRDRSEKYVVLDELLRHIVQEHDPRGRGGGGGAQDKTAVDEIYAFSLQHSGPFEEQLYGHPRLRGMQMFEVDNSARVAESKAIVMDRIAPEAMREQLRQKVDALERELGGVRQMSGAAGLDVEYRGAMEREGLRKELQVSMDELQRTVSRSAEPSSVVEGEAASGSVEVRTTLEDHTMAAAVELRMRELKMQMDALQHCKKADNAVVGLYEVVTLKRELAAANRKAEELNRRANALAESMPRGELPKWDVADVYATPSSVDCAPRNGLYRVPEDNLGPLVKSTVAMIEERKCGCGAQFITESDMGVAIVNELLSIDGGSSVVVADEGEEDGGYKSNLVRLHRLGHDMVSRLRGETRVETGTESVTIRTNVGVEMEVVDSEPEEDMVGSEESDSD